ncbi:MAG: ATP-binding protein [Candidatus Ozemobacteraceae bacterium]
MKQTGISRASGLVRFFFIIILLARIYHSHIVVFSSIFPWVLNFHSPAFFWLACKALVDLVFLGLVWTRFDRIWVAPVTFFWLSIQTIVSVEGYEISIDGLRTITCIFPFILVGGLVVGKIFTWSGIRGRILIVCLASACLPMFYLGLALVQQTGLMIKKAYFPMAREMVETDLLRLNDAILQKVNQDLGVLMGVPPNASGAMNIPLASESEYWTRAASLSIPLETIMETSPVWGSETISLDFESIQLQFFLDILRKKYDISYDLRSQIAAEKMVTFHAKNATIEQILRQLDLIPELSTHWEKGILVVNSKSEPGTTSVRLAMGTNGSSRDPDFREFEQVFSHEREVPAHFNFSYTPEHHQLLIRIPEWKEKQIVRGILLKINFGKWLETNVNRELNSSGNYQIKCILPGTLKQTRLNFEGYEVVSEKGPNLPIAWENLGFPFEDSALADGKIKVLDRPIFDIHLTPRLVDYSGFRNLTIHSPRMTDFILECWEFSFCQAPIFVMLATDHVWEALFRNQVKSVIYCFLAVLLAAFMSFVYSDRLSRPIREITIAAREIRDGKLNEKIPEQTGEGEIEELATSLNLMAEKLTGRIALANQQLISEKERFETLVESTWEGIFLLDFSGALLYANPAGKKLLETIHEMENFSKVLRAVGTEFQPPLAEPWQNGTKEFKGNFQLPCGSQGDRKIMALYIRACHNTEAQEGMSLESGYIPTMVYIAVLRDITVEKEIDRMKSDFVSQVSHELRTPLTSIKAFTEMLLDDEVDDPESRRDYLRITYDEAERLTRLINDLLDIARIESGRQPLKLTGIDLASLTREIAQVMKAQIEKAKQTLSLNIPSDQILLIGDADLLKQAGLNLLSNASKYTKPGGTITLSVEKRPDGKLIWKFSDTGVGLSPQDKDKLFEKFFRAESEFVRAAGGTGLGLVLVKNIIDLHQGEILVDSVFEKGTTFTLVLPSGKTT